MYVGGAMLVSPDTVLPNLAHLLGAPNWVIGIIPGATLLGWGLPALFMAQHVDRMHRLKPLVTITGALQRLPYLIAGLVLLHFGTASAASWIAVVLMPFLSGLVGGVSSAAWMELLTRALPSRCRASAWAWRYFFTAMLGLPAGYVVSRVLAAHPGPEGYAYLYFLTFCCLMVSFALFVSLREPPPDPGWKPQHHASWRESVLSAFALVRENRQLGRYFVSRLVFILSGLVTPFFAIQAIAAAKQPSSFVGQLLIATVIGSGLGTLIAGWLGDKFGAKLGLQLAQAVIFIATVVLVFYPACPYASGWLVLASLRGFGGSLALTSTTVMTAELCSPARRTSWFALNQSCTAPLLLITGLVSGWIQSKWGSIAPSAVVSCVVLAIAAVLLAGVVEPRRASIAEIIPEQPEG